MFAPWKGMITVMTDQEQIKELRKMIFTTAYKGNTGHLASAFSVIEILYVLYFKGIMKYDASSPQWENRDKLVMSKGQGSLALYSVLSKAGFFPKEELSTFCRPDSRLGGEPRLGDIPGVEASTGSLGHGLSYAVGMAMAYKMQDKENHVYVIIGDGECQEGSVWEAAMAAANFKLDNMTVIMDNNKLQAMGTVKELMGIDDWTGKWKEFGWNVINIDGHNVDEIEKALKSPNVMGSPTIIIANTIKGKGVSFMENVPIWHFRMPNEEELKVVLRELDIKEEELK